MENDTPAYKSMVYYFSKPEISKSKFKGRPRITLPVKLNNDLQITNRTSNRFFEKYGVRELTEVCYKFRKTKNFSIK